MNERIKELAEQAFDTADYPEDQLYRIEPNPAFCKKFAELIVQECASELSRVPGGYDSSLFYKNSRLLKNILELKNEREN